MKAYLVIYIYSVGFLEYFNYIRKLEFDELPDYDKLRRGFEETLFEDGDFDLNMDWENVK